MARLIAERFTLFRRMVRESISASQMMFGGALLVLTLLAPCERKAVMNEKAPSNNNQENEEISAGPPFALEVAPEYLIGFPMIVAVTLSNTSPSRTFYNLPSCDLFTVTSPVEFVFSSGGDIVRVGASTVQRREGPPRGFTLRPGEARRMLFDVAGLEPKLHAGTWRVEARYHARMGAVAASPVSFRLIQPEAAEAQAVTALQRNNDLKTASWLDFLQANWRTVNAASLSARGQSTLALHLFLHRAIYGPLAVAQLRAEDLRVQGAAESEAALFRLEILLARKDPQAAMEEARLLQQWPGLRWRVEELRRGEGLLRILRQQMGAERPNRPSGAMPYTN